jgi:hypothetical protein
MLSITYGSSKRGSRSIASTKKPTCTTTVCQPKWNKGTRRFETEPHRNTCSLPTTTTSLAKRNPCKVLTCCIIKIMMSSPPTVTGAARTPEQEFEAELEIFRTEAETAAKFFYSYLAMHEVAKRHKSVFRMFDENALFWNTVVGGVQAAAMIALGRIFDQRSPHNLDVLIGLTERHCVIFSKAALGKRKQGSAAKPPPWLKAYLNSVYEPTTNDFQRLKNHVRKHRQTYDKNYRALRNKYYAHKQAADPASIAALVAKTNIREMQRLFTFLLQLHQALQQLFANGTKPTLRPFRHSAQRIKQRPSTNIIGDAVHERILKQAEQALLGLAQQRNKQP